MLVTHSIIYFTTFIVSYYLSYCDVYRFINLIILGWSLLGLTSIGHEIYHLEHNDSILFKILGFICLDLWSVPRHIWILRHNKMHHYHPWDENEDEHMIKGSILTNFINTIIVLTKTYRLLEPSWVNILLMLFRIVFFSQISYYAIFVVYTTLTLCTTYLTFISHAAPVIIKNDPPKLKQIHRSVDIFPGNYIWALITGGFNMHTAHHLKPDITRNGLYNIHTKYKKQYPDDYRTIDSFNELFRLVIYCYVEFESPNEWNEKIKINNKNK